MGRTLKGRAAKLYRNTGTWAIPVWTEIDIIKDAKYQLSPQMTDVTVRKHGAWKRQEQTLLDFSAEFDLRVQVDKLADANYVALRDAAVNATPIEFAFTNGPIATAGNEMLRITCELSGFGEEQPLGDDVKINVSLVACDSDNDPEFDETA